MYTQRVPVTPPHLPVPPTPRRRARRPVARGAPAGSSVGAQPAAAAPVGKVWVPIIPAARRRLLDELHRGLSEGLARGLRAYLHEGDQFAFAGLTLETFDCLAAEQTGTALAARFAVEGHKVKGFVLGGAPLASYFARACLGPAGAATVSRPLTRLESALASRAFDQLLGLVSKAYAGAGVGLLKFSGKDETLRHSPAFGSDEYLLAFRYRVGAAAAGLTLILAVSLELAEALPASAPTVPAKTAGAGSRAGAILPVAAAIVLGGWTVPMAAVAALKPGDELMLPDGSDAWLEVEGLRLRPLGVELAERILRVRPREVTGGQS